MSDSKEKADAGEEASRSSYSLEMEQYNLEQGANFARAASQDSGSKKLVSNALMEKPAFYLPTQYSLSSSSDASDDDQKPVPAKESPPLAVETVLEDTETEEEEDPEGAAFKKNLKKRNKRKHSPDKDPHLNDGSPCKKRKCISGKPPVKKKKLAETRDINERLNMTSKETIAVRAGHKPEEEDKTKKAKGKRTQAK